MASLAQALLAPRSVAIIGASDDVSKAAGRPLRFLRQSRFEGTVYPVNPARAMVQDERAWSSLAALPEVPDHAFIVLPVDAALDAAAECGRLGVAVVTLLASGFSEAGESGRLREDRLRRIVAETGVRVVGPSSLGVVNVRQRLILTANAAFAEPELLPGSTFVASHSGSMIGGLLSRGKSRGLGFAGLVSVGNEVDLSIGEICHATVDDPAVQGYLLFLETIRKAEALRAFARAAADRGKPVIAYKLGRSREAAELSISHTGALAGEDDVADAFLRDCGIARVETLDALIEGLPLLARMPVTGERKPRVGVVTTTGGGAAMVVDQLGVRNVIVEAPTARTLTRLADAGASVSPGRIVDLTLAGTRYGVMKAALDVMLAAPEFDLVVAVCGSSARHQPDLAVRPVIDSAASGKPLAAFVVPDAPQALQRLTAAGVPNFRTPESCADAIAAAFARRAPRRTSFRVAWERGGEGRLIDELEAYALLSRLGVPHAPAEAIDADGVQPAPSMPYPLVVKVLSAALPHKSDVGGVVVGVKDGRELEAATARVRANVAASRPGNTADRVLVQQMVTDGLGEVLLGYRFDANVGPIVMLAAGGVLTEIYRDRSVRLAPVDLAEAVEMINEVKALRALAGYRGQPAGDLEALAAAIVALSQLAVAPDAAVLEAEMNPVIVRPAGMGVIAVDALVRVE